MINSSRNTQVLRRLIFPDKTAHEFERRDQALGKQVFSFGM